MFYRSLCVYVCLADAEVFCDSVPVRTHRLTYGVKVEQNCGRGPHANPNRTGSYWGSREATRPERTPGSRATDAMTAGSVFCLVARNDDMTER